MVRTALIVVALAASLVGASGIDAEAASQPIGPHQHFVGVVNGKHTDAVIYTVCGGPPTGNGPPAGGQTVAVRRVAAAGGDTGSGARVIYARITPTTIVELKAYDVSRAIPTSARVPCQGRGTVVFSTCPLPQPCGVGARADSVPVRFIDIGADARRRAVSDPPSRSASRR